MNDTPSESPKRTPAAAWSQTALFCTGAVMVALAAILFAKCSNWGNALFDRIVTDSPLAALIITPAGFALIVWLTRTYFAGAEGSGIPQAIAALSDPTCALRNPILSLRTAVGKILMTTLGLCVGASVGREGPTVQIGAAIMHKLGLHFHPDDPIRIRVLVLAGGAAGIAAAFNTPLAGVMFAIEELSRSFEERSSGTALTAVIIAGVVSLALLGNYSYFGHTNVSLPLAMAIRPVLICGIVGGLLGGCFSRLILFSAQSLPSTQAGQWIKANPVRFAALCGLGIALVSLLLGPHAFGTGYQQAKGLIEGTQAMPTGYWLGKFVATALSYISGLPGGLFAPSLSVGAGLGSELSPLFPATPAAAVVILGMVGYFSGVVQVPITATIIVMEMNSDSSLTLPLMATALIASTLSKRICPQPLYRTLAHLYLQQVGQTPLQSDKPIEK